MAKNWLVGEAAEALKVRKKEDVAELFTRFPLTASILVRLNDAGTELANAIPSYITVRKLENVLKGDTDIAVNDNDDAGEDAEEVEIPAPKKAGKEKAAKEEKRAEKKSKKPAVVEDEDDDFDDEEEEEPAPKKAKKADKKAAKKEEKKSKKPAKKVVEEEDEDDDFDDFDFDDDDE